MNTFCLENKSVKMRTHFCITEYLTTLHPTAFSSHKPLAFMFQPVVPPPVDCEPFW